MKKHLNLSQVNQREEREDVNDIDWQEIIPNVILTEKNGVHCPFNRVKGEKDNYVLLTIGDADEIIESYINILLDIIHKSDIDITKKVEYIGLLYSIFKSENKDQIKIKTEFLTNIFAVEKKQDLEESISFEDIASQFSLYLQAHTLPEIALDNADAKPNQELNCVQVQAKELSLPSLNDILKHPQKGDLYSSFFRTSDVKDYYMMCIDDLHDAGSIICTYKNALTCINTFNPSKEFDKKTIKHHKKNNIVKIKKAFLIEIMGAKTEEELATKYTFEEIKKGYKEFLEKKKNERRGNNQPTLFSSTNISQEEPLFNHKRRRLQR